MPHWAQYQAMLSKPRVDGRCNECWNCRYTNKNRNEWICRKCSAALSCPSVIQGKQFGDLPHKCNGVFLATHATCRNPKQHLRPDYVTFKSVCRDVFGASICMIVLYFLVGVMKETGVTFDSIQHNGTLSPAEIRLLKLVETTSQYLGTTDVFSIFFCVCLGFLWWHRPIPLRKFVPQFAVGDKTGDAEMRLERLEKMFGDLWGVLRQADSVNEIIESAHDSREQNVNETIESTHDSREQNESTL